MAKTDMRGKVQTVLGPVDAAELGVPRSRTLPLRLSMWFPSPRGQASGSVPTSRSPLRTWDGFATTLTTTGTTGSCWTRR